MKKLYFLTIIISVLSTKAVQSQQKMDSSFLKALMELAYKRIEAFDTGDTSIWSPYVANEYIIATPTGKVITKAEVMRNFGPPLNGYRDVFHFEDVFIAKDNNVAVMSYKIKEHEWWGNQENDVPDLRKTDTYIFRDGNWLLLASHETFYPVQRNIISVNPNIFNSYVGRYQVMPGLTYTVTNENGKLMIQENTNPEKAELFPLSANVFFSQPDTGFFNEGGVGEVVFIKGKVDSILFGRYGADIRAQKIK